LSDDEIHLCFFHNGKCCSAAESTEMRDSAAYLGVNEIVCASCVQSTANHASQCAQLQFNHVARAAALLLALSRACRWGDLEASRRTGRCSNWLTLFPSD